MSKNRKIYLPEEYTGPSDFAHLHNHTIRSVLDGVATAEQYAEECHKRGWGAMSATEHGNMASVPDMYFEFRKYGLKAIYGCEIYYNDYEPLRREIQRKGSAKKLNLKEKDPILDSRIRRNRHLTILCKNKVGFHNLIKLTSEAYRFGFHYKPRIWFDKLCEYKEGLIVLSGCLNGPVAHELRLDAKHEEEGLGKIKRRPKLDHSAAQYVKKFQEVFGEDYYIETQMPCLPEIYDHVAFWELVALADDFGIPVVLANDVHYMKREEFYIQKVMMAAQQERTIDDPDLFHINSDDQYMKTRAELWATFKNNRYSEKVEDSKFEEMCDNSLLVASRCDDLEMDTNLKIPDWSDVEPDQIADKELRKLVAISIKKKKLDRVSKRYLVDGKMVTYVEQARIELDRFISKGFASYFLITSDILGFGRKQGWPFGPRGSAGGSLVCYLLGIHGLDPLKWELSFDRFMSSSRGGYQLKVTME